MADESKSIPNHQLWCLNIGILHSNCWMSHVDPFGPKLVDLRKIGRCGQGLLFLPDMSRNGKQHSLPKYSYTIEDLGIIYIWHMYRFVMFQMMVFTCCRFFGKETSWISRGLSMSRNLICVVKRVLPHWGNGIPTNITTYNLDRNWFLRFCLHNVVNPMPSHAVKGHQSVA